MYKNVVKRMKNEMKPKFGDKSYHPSLSLDMLEIKYRT